MTVDLPSRSAVERAMLAGRSEAGGPVERAAAPALPTPRRWRGMVAIVATGAAALRGDIGRDVDRGTRFLFVPLLMAAGVLAYFGLAAEPALGSLAAGTLVLAVICRLGRGRQALFHLTAAMLAFTVGMLAAKLETVRAGTRIIGGEISTTVTGRVLTIEHQANGRVRLTLDVLKTEAPELRYQPDRVRLSARRIPAGLAPGAEIAGLARLGQPSGPVRPGGYDFAFRSYFDGIGATGFFLRDPALAPHPSEPDAMTRFDSAVESARLGLAERIRGSIGGAEGEIAAALIVGVRAGIPEDVNEALRRTGLAHVLSISGLHMALVAATLMGGLRLAFALFPDFASRHPVRKYAAALALAGSLAYLWISGGEVAAQRSFIMLAVMLAALMLDRAALTVRNLAISAVIVILLSPHEVAGPSFQMSFAATAALVGGYAAWSQWRQERPRGALRLPERGPLRRLVRWLALFVAGLAFTSLIAGLATTIYGVYHFQRVSPLSLAANLAAMPFVSVLVMPFAVLAMIAMPFSLDGPFLAVMGFGLKMMIAVAEWFSVRSPLDAVGLISGRSVLVLTAALALATLSSTRLRLAALPLGAVGLAMALWTPQPTVFVSEDARLVSVDLGDGRMAVNRARSNGFTVENWLKAAGAETVVGPEKAAPAVAAAVQSGIAASAGAGAGMDGAAAFRCSDGLCIAAAGVGFVVAHAADARTAASACAPRGLLVIEDPSARNPCRGKGMTVLTGRDLARHGSAAIGFAAGGRPVVEHAIAEPYRPWHEHRRFSRAARGMKPWRPGAGDETPKSDRESAAPDQPATP